MRTASSRRILKNSEVKLEGKFGLSVEPVTSESAPCAPLQARIVENGPDYVIIELCCSCGRKTHLRCDYAQPSQSAPQPGK